ncbi:hypothetical protein Patl1_20383 [Pistacia atlantica]|uniref:Uncharacterized protein n=1 Tax=Pistacia atlantica TaxID=434234 RepID=A0ACC1BJH2_9ROSI|nr:hypothetical protein Patl1_20383 [Pistacia atlantica]
MVNLDPESHLAKWVSRLKFHRTTLCLAYQSFGVVCGDFRTSPLYVYKSIFSRSLRVNQDDHEILGVLSLIFWTLTLIPLCKYVISVLGADDNGEVLSAVHGIQIKVPALHENYILFIACIILLGLFALQHLGHIELDFFLLQSWLLGCYALVELAITTYFTGTLVLFLLCHHTIFITFDKKAGKDGWHSLGGIVLCIAGAEAMFADLGHFSQIAFTGFVYPCLVLAYMGEAAYLSQHKMDLRRSFYLTIPELVFWPVFIVATLATAVASQEIISATYLYYQSIDTDMIGNAYGLAAITVMFVKTCLMFLIICTVWKRNIFIGFLFVMSFGSLELLYFSASLAKVNRGGWLPLLISLALLTLMLSWHYGTSEKLAFELQNKISIDSLVSLGPSLGVSRVPGIGLVYSNVTSGVPPTFAHFVTNFLAFHKILIFETFQYVMVPKVPASEQFLVSRIAPPEFCLFQCICEVLGSHDKEVMELMEAKEAGVAYMTGNTHVLASETSFLAKKFAINVVYGLLRRNCCRPAITVH